MGTECKEGRTRTIGRNDLTAEEDPGDLRLLVVHLQPSGIPVSYRKPQGPKKAEKEGGLEGRERKKENFVHWETESCLFHH
jgi:hypothetical protein